MSVLLGADTLRVDAVAEGLRGRSQDIADLRSMAQRAVAEMRNSWAGPDFESIAQRWEQETGPRLTDVSTLLSVMATTLSAQADEQRQASGGGMASGDGGGARGGGRRRGLAGLDPGDVSGAPRTVPERESEDSNGTDTRSSTLFSGHLFGTAESRRTDVFGQGVPERTPGDRFKDSVKVNLAAADAGADASLASLKGGNDNAAFELAAAKVEARADYSLDLDAHGNLVASAGGSAAAYAGYAAGKIRGGRDFANGAVGAKALVGAEVETDVSSSIGPDGARGHLGAEAFVGAKAEVEAEGTLAGVTAGAGAEISYGVGVHAEVDANVSMTEVGVSVDIGATLGIGVGAKLDVSVNPVEVMANLASLPPW